ncbi:hypothetical protein JCM5350_000756 [Sporobolomyces pararoseus]
MSSLNVPTSQTPIETPSTSGNCVVCGKETKTRCSPCLKHGNGGIWYCSEAHQKLTWSLHKRVCGPRSSPFRFPLLSEREIKRIEEIYYQPYLNQEGEVETLAQRNERDPPPLHEKLKHVCGVHDFFFHFMLRNIAEVFPNPEVSLDSASNQSALIRSTAFKIRHGIKTYSKSTNRPDLLDTFKEEPLGFMAYLEQAILPRFMALPNVFGSFWSTFQHKLLILVSLLHTMVLEAQPRSEIETYYEYNLSEMERFLKYVVAQTHPDEAELLRKGLLDNDGALRKTIRLDWTEAGEQVVEEKVQI